MPRAQLTPNIAMQPYISIVSIKIGNEPAVRNDMIFMATIPTVTPNDRTLVGKTSTVHMNDSDRMPIPETRITNAKLVTGTQFNIDKSNPSESQ